MMLRSAINYDPFTESWSLSTRSCLSEGSSQANGERISADILKNSSPETQHLFMTYSKFIKALMSTIHGDLLVLKLLIIMSLFSGEWGEKIPLYIMCLSIELIQRMHNIHWNSHKECSTVRER